MEKKWMLIILIPVFIGCADGYAHGLKHEALKGGVGVAFSYHDGAPAASCEVTVFSPEGSEEAFQRGLTDKNGRFLFYPHVAGTWRIIVDDGTGHVLSHVTVDGAASAKIIAVARLQGSCSACVGGRPKPRARK